MPLHATAATRAAWRRAILEYTAAHPDRPLKPPKLAGELRISNSDYNLFRALIRELLRDGTLVLGPKRTIVLPARAATLAGIFRQGRHGLGRFDCPELSRAAVRRGFTAGALDGDRVAARLLKRRGPGGRRVVEVTQILERAHTRWVGVLEQRGNRWVVQPHRPSTPRRSCRSTTPPPRVPTPETWSSSSPSKPHWEPAPFTA